MSSTVVLGGGIAGLSAAYYASKLNHTSVRLLEATERLGGWIRSNKNDNGVVFEAGPRTMRTVGEPGLNTLELLDELNLNNEICPVLKSSPAAKNRMLYVNGCLHPLPNSMASLFKTIAPFSKPLITALYKDITSPSVPVKDDSIHNFVARRFGSEVADYAVGALVCGVCAGDSKRISVNLLMSRLFEWEQNHGSVIGGMFKTAFTKESKDERPQPVAGNLSKRVKKEGWSVWSLKGGLEKLPRAIEEKLVSKENVTITRNSTCQKIEFTQNEVQLEINDGKTERAEHIYCALPANKLASILPHQHLELQQELLAIPFVTVGVVNLEYNGNVLPVDGFGFLVPPNQKLPILGVIFDTCCFPQEGKTVLTVMMGGAWFTDLFGSDPKPERLLEIAVDQVNLALSIKQHPVNSRVNILKDCIPQYIVGHKARVERIRKYISERKLPLTLLGSSYDGVGVNDVIFSARRSVQSRF